MRVASLQSPGCIDRRRRTSGDSSVRVRLALLAAVAPSLGTAHAGTCSSASTIAGGGYHSCAITSTGATECWGLNTEGELGNGTTTSSLIPLSVSGLLGATTLAAGGYHSCALLSSGGVACWGYNASGELGNGSTSNSSTPEDVYGLSGGAKDVAAGLYHTCAVTTVGGALCWGFNMYGEVGNGTNQNSYSTPVSVLIGPFGTVTAVSAGAYFTCAVTGTGAALCWGLNSEGQLGTGVASSTTTPAAVHGLSSGIVAVSAGTYHACALTSTGSVYCWGSNTYGQLGNGTTSASRTPVAVTGLSGGAIAIAAGSFHSCAITTVGGVECWGANGEGELGNGTNVNSATPVAVSGLSSGVTAITAGGGSSEGFTCALTNLGSEMCWGINNYGQLGDGNVNGTPSNVPVAVSGLSASNASCVATSTSIDGPIPLWALISLGAAFAGIAFKHRKPGWT